MELHERLDPEPGLKDYLGRVDFFGVVCWMSRGRWLGEKVSCLKGVSLFFIDAGEPQVHGLGHTIVKALRAALVSPVFQSPPYGNLKKPVGVVDAVIIAFVVALSLPSS